MLPLLFFLGKSASVPVLADIRLTRPQPSLWRRHGQTQLPNHHYQRSHLHQLPCSRLPHRQHCHGLVRTYPDRGRWLPLRRRLSVWLLYVVRRGATGYDGEAGMPYGNVGWKHLLNLYPPSLLEADHRYRFLRPGANDDNRLSLWREMPCGLRYVMGCC